VKVSFEPNGCAGWPVKRPPMAYRWPSGATAPPRASTDPMPPRASTDPMPPGSAARATLTDEKTTTPMVRALPALAAAQDSAKGRESARPSRSASREEPSTSVVQLPRRSALPIVGALLALLLAAALGFAALRGDSPAADGDAKLPASSSAPAALSAPPEPPLATAEPAATSAEPSASGSNTSSDKPPSGQARPAGSPFPARPPAKLGCTYQDEKKITRITQCSHPDCVRRGRACKPIGGR
jgi:hypothetical protein